MLKLTKKADYGLIAHKHLANGHGGTASAKEIADAYGIPLPLLAKILQKLTKTGLLVSAAGSSGGDKPPPHPPKNNGVRRDYSVDGADFFSAGFFHDRRGGSNGKIHGGQAPRQRAGSHN